MKKQILNNGKALSKNEQKQILGGNPVGYFGKNACHRLPEQECVSANNCVWYTDTSTGYCDGNVPHIVINP